jgi:hypothetical protein
MSGLTWRIMREVLIVASSAGFTQSAAKGIDPI